MKSVECEICYREQAPSGISFKPLCDDCIITHVNKRGGEMRSKEEVEKMFDMIKTDLDKIEDATRTGDSLEECKRLVLSAQIGILLGVGKMKTS